MSYEAPTFVEITMDSEIGSYQNEFDFDDAPRFCRSEAASEPASADVG